MGADVKRTNSMKYAKRGPVIIPVEPPYEVLRAIKAFCTGCGSRFVRLTLIRWGWKRCDHRK